MTLADRPGKSIKGPAFEKIMLPEYQRNDIDNCLFLFTISPTRFSNYPFVRSFLFGRSFLSKWDVFGRNPLSKARKTSENNKQDIPLFSFLAIMTLGCTHAFCPLGGMEFPMTRLVIQWGGLFIPPRE